MKHVSTHQTTIPIVPPALILTYPHTPLLELASASANPLSFSVLPFSWPVVTRKAASATSPGPQWSDFLDVTSGAQTLGSTE